MADATNDAACSLCGNRTRELATCNACGRIVCPAHRTGSGNLEDGYWCSLDCVARTYFPQHFQKSSLEIPWVRTASSLVLPILAFLVTFAIIWLLAYMLANG